jgi:uncharacterized membrane protein
MVSPGLRTYITITDIEQRIGQNMKIHAQRTDRRGELVPLIVTVVVAVAGTVGILLSNLDLGNDSQGSSTARMITAAAVSRAGAIEIPSEPSSAGANEGVSG